MASKRARFVRAMSRRYFQSIDASRVDPQAMRRRWHRFARWLPTPRRVTRTQTEIAGRHAEWLTPRDAVADKLMIYWHGGAYIMGNCATHRQLVGHLARGAGVKALLAEYRLAPEHPFPAAIEDAVSIYRALLAEGYRPADIVMGGDSAGGGLTMATLLSLRDAGEPLPAGAFLISPWLDLAGTGESMQTHDGRDPWFKPKNLPTVRANYCDESQIRNPLVSPVYADVTGLPPCFIQVGSEELLLSDSTRIDAALHAAGVESELEIWPGMWHVFQLVVHLVPEARRANAKIAARIRGFLGLSAA